MCKIRQVDRSEIWLNKSVLAKKQHVNNELERRFDENGEMMVARLKTMAYQLAPEDNRSREPRGLGDGQDEGIKERREAWTSGFLAQVMVAMMILDKICKRTNRGKESASKSQV